MKRATSALWYIAFNPLIPLFTFGIAFPLAPAAPLVPEIACPSCDDLNGCTIDSCDTSTGTCRHDPLNCDDQNPCTIDSCLANSTPLGGVQPLQSA